MTWIKTNVFKTIPNGYNLVVLIHEGLVRDTNGSYLIYEQALPGVNRAAFTPELESFANHTEDYEDTNVNKVIVVCGHWHEDLQSYKNGIVHIGVACDALYNDYIHSPLCNYETRREGTVLE